MHLNENRNEREMEANRARAALDRRVVELLESIADGVFAHHTRDSIREQCRALLAEIKNRI